MGLTEDHFLNGVRLCDAGRTDEAIAEWVVCLEASPGHADTHYNLGVALAEKGREVEAIRRSLHDDGDDGAGVGARLRPVPPRVAAGEVKGTEAERQGGHAVMASDAPSFIPTICQACRRHPVETVLDNEQPDQPYRLCLACARRIEMLSLRPLEWFNLAAIHGPAKYLLHDDFYYDSGTTGRSSRRPFTADSGRRWIMANWHIEDLYDALAARGWSITEHPGDGLRVSGTWEVQRSTWEPPLHIDFDGLDDLRCLPMAEAYACRVRGRLSLSLYFGRKGSTWRDNLREFVDAIDHDDARLLARLMSDISERCYSAGWMHGTEEVLWCAVQEGPLRWGHGDVTAQDIAMLKALSTAAGGWVVWDVTTRGTSVPMAEWLNSHGAVARGDGNADG